MDPPPLREKEQAHKRSFPGPVAAESGRSDCVDPPPPKKGVPWGAELKAGMKAGRRGVVARYM